MRKQDWTFLTSHADALLRIARDPDLRVSDLAGRLGLSERGTYNVLADLCDAGFLVRRRGESSDGRRTHYELNRELPLRGRMLEARTVGELLRLLDGSGTH